MWAITQPRFRQEPNQGDGTGGGQYQPEDITPPGSQSTQPTKFQERIGELTSTIKQQQDALTRSEETQRQLMATIAQIQAAQAAQNRPAQEPAIPQLQVPEGADPTMVSLLQQQQAMFQKMLADQAARTEQMVGQATARTAQTTAQLELQAALAGQPEAVQKEATRLFGMWQNANLTGWAPKDAVIYARGALGITGAAPARPGNQTIETITPGGSTQAAPIPGQGGTPLPAPLPDEVLARMSLAQTEAYWRKRLEAQGGVDQPLLVR